MIVILCTLALFLSGYVIQQRTLRELRIAIKPRSSRPSPKVYLPDRFKASTTELEDGTIVVVETEAEVETKEQVQVIEVKESVPEEVQQDEPEEAKKDEPEVVEGPQAKVEGSSWGVEHPDPSVKSQKPISRAERRRLIKEEIKRLSQADKPMYYQRRLW